MKHSVPFQNTRDFTKIYTLSIFTNLPGSQAVERHLVLFYLFPPFSRAHIEKFLTFIDFMVMVDYWTWELPFGDRSPT